MWVVKYGNNQNNFFNAELQFHIYVYTYLFQIYIDVSMNPMLISIFLEVIENINEQRYNHSTASILKNIVRPSREEN